MTKRKLRSALSVALLALLASALGWMNWRLAAMPVSLPPAATADQAVVSDQAPAAASHGEAVVPEFASYQVIAERPLFLPGRRADGVTVAEAAPAQAPASPQWQLSGILLDGNVARALLKADDGQPALWVQQDAEISGWRVVRIDARGVLLKSGDDEQLVELYPAPIAEAPSTR